MAIDPRLLRTLLAVAREGSFSAAGRLLNMSQPAVSMAIAQLERAVGARLINRGKQEWGITQAGRILTRRAEMIETVLDLAGREVALGMNEIEGPLIIGGTPGALMSLVPGAIHALDRAGSSFALRIVEAADSELYAMLRDLSIDFAVGTIGVGTVPADIIERAVVSDSFTLVMRAGHDFAGEKAALSEVAALDWVLPDVGGAFQRQIEALFLHAGITVPQRAIRCDSLATTKEIVRQSNHITILPYRVVAPEVASGQLRRVALVSAPPPRTIGVRMLRDRAQMPLANRFIEAMAAGVIHVD